jgi:hypothetical protein
LEHLHSHGENDTLFQPKEQAGVLGGIIYQKNLRAFLWLKRCDFNRFGLAQRPAVIIFEGASLSPPGPIEGPNSEGRASGAMFY